jgi:hypothetical protein
VAVTRSTAASVERSRMSPECARPDPRGMLRRRSELCEGGEPACRPGSVPPLARGGGHPSGTAVADSLVRSTREHRAGRPRSLAQGTIGSPLDLAPGGVYRAAAVTCGAGGLLHHRFTLTLASRRQGGLFSVALSRGSPRVGVTDHPALWSPDLPHRACARRGRPADSPVLRIRRWPPRRRSEPAPANAARDPIAADTERSAISSAHVLICEISCRRDSSVVRSQRGTDSGVRALLLTC